MFGMNRPGSIGYTRRVFDASNMYNCRFRVPHWFPSPIVTPFAVLDSTTSLPTTVMSYNGPLEPTNGDPSLDNQKSSVPTHPTPLLPSVDLSPPQRRAVGPDRSFTKAALGRPRPAPYSRSRDTSAASHAEPVWPAWLAPQSAMKRSANERGPQRHWNTSGASSSSNRATGENDLGFGCAAHPNALQESHP